MSLQWKLIAAFLYTEIAVVILLLLPIFSSQWWNKIFKSRVFRVLGQYVQFYFYFTLIILSLCFYDAIQNMKKYALTENGKPKVYNHINQELRNSTELFKAQRNFYITGFTLFFIFVIRRLMMLHAAQANLEANSEAAIRQATSASKAAEELMSQKDKSATDVNVEEAEKKISQLKEELSEARKERTRAVKDLEALKSQSEGITREYDRLAEEHKKLVMKMAILDGKDGSDKKCD